MGSFTNCSSELSSCAHTSSLLSRLNVAFCDSFYPGAVMSWHKILNQHSTLTSHPALEMAVNNAREAGENTLRNPQFAISFVDKKRLSYLWFLYSFRAWSWNMPVLISCHHEPELGSRYLNAANSPICWNIIFFNWTEFIICGPVRTLISFPNIKQHFPSLSIII